MNERGRVHTFTMDSLVCAMSVMTPSEMMRRMKYWEPSLTADAYLKKVRRKDGGRGIGRVERMRDKMKERVLGGKRIKR